MTSSENGGKRGTANFFMSQWLSQTSATKRGAPYLWCVCVGGCGCLGLGGSIGDIGVLANHYFMPMGHCFIVMACDSMKH